MCSEVVLIGLWGILLTDNSAGAVSVVLVLQFRINQQFQAGMVLWSGLCSEISLFLITTSCDMVMA